MATVYYTCISKQHHCPMWDIDLKIIAKYRFFDDENPHIGKFASCSCPILENLKLPTKKQSQEYELFRYCKIKKECLNSINFSQVIDFSEGG